MDIYVGVPVQISATITNAAGNLYSLSTVSASYGSVGAGPPQVIAMTEASTGVYTATVTPKAQTVFSVWVYGYDSVPSLQVVGRLQVPVLGAPAI